MNYINASGGRSMAYDFTTRSNLKNAINQRLFSQLKTIDGKPTGAIGWWPSMCVTLLEDHDTAVDGNSAQPFGDGDQVLQGYAYLMTHPGIPCVFWSHYFDWGSAIQQTISELILIRKNAGLNSSSVVNIVAATMSRCMPRSSMARSRSNWGPLPGIQGLDGRLHLAGMTLRCGRID